MSTCLRMCVVCRQMKSKDELLRIAKYEGDYCVDLSGKHPGRGAYICKKGDCSEKFEAKRAFERAFKGAVPQELKDNIKKELI